MTRDIGLGTRLIQAGVFDVSGIKDKLDQAGLTPAQLDRLLEVSSSAADPDTVITEIAHHPDWLSLPADQLHRLALVIGSSLKIGEWIAKRSELTSSLLVERPNSRDELVADFVSGNWKDDL